MKIKLSNERHSDYDYDLMYHGVTFGPVTYVGLRRLGQPRSSGSRWFFVGNSVTIAMGPLDGIMSGFADARPARLRVLRRRFPAVAIGVD